MSDSFHGLPVYGLSPTRLLYAWDSPGKKTGVGCHFLLQGNLPNPGIKPTSLRSPVLAGGFFTTSATWEALNVLIRQFSSVAQLCPTLYNPMDCSVPGSPVYGISQARILEWVANPFYRGIVPTQGSDLGLLHCRQFLYHLSHQGSPLFYKTKLYFTL